MGADCRGGAAEVQRLERLEDEVGGEWWHQVSTFCMVCLFWPHFCFLLLVYFMLMSLLFAVAAFCLLSSDYHISDMELHKKAKRNCPDSVRTRPGTGYISKLAI